MSTSVLPRKTQEFQGIIVVTEEKGESMGGLRGRALRHQSRTKRQKKTGHLVLGLTGSLASGKSTTLKVFRKAGWAVASADQMVSEIYEEWGLTKNEILRRFGGSERGMRKLEAWIHPLVAKKMKAFVERSRRPTMIEVPLLFEAKLEKAFDAVIFIYAPYAARLKRVLKRGMSQKLFHFLDRRQWASLKKAEAADFILHNHSKEALRAQASELSKYLKSAH